MVMARRVIKAARIAARIAALGGAMLALAAPALAEEAKQGGLPQLNPHGFAPQLIWLAITFLLLYVAMSRMVLPRIGAILQRREEKITGDLERAQELQREAQELSAAMEKSLAEARAKAQATARATADAVNADIGRRQQELGQRLGKQIADAEQRITAARQTALDNVKSVAAEVAQAAFARLSGSPASAETAERYVGDVLKARS